MSKKKQRNEYNGGNWTEGRYRSFVTSTIRGGFRRWPVKFQVLKDALVGKEINPASGRMASMYRCSSCDGKFSSTNVQVDHIEPVVPVSGFVSWDSFIENLFCEKDNLQVLCKACHSEKTKQEKQERKK